MIRPLRVVFDCNVYFQAAISEVGPASQCVRKVVEREIVLYASAYIVREFEGVCSRPELRRKFGITDQSVLAIVAFIRDFSTMLTDIPERYQVPNDPKDSHYVDLALAADAHLIVSRDRDLLRLRETNNRDGAAFVRRFPNLEIMQPPDLLRRLAAGGSG